MSNNHEAREAIQSFTNRYASFYPNGDHVELIQLAAFPVAVTVHLLYQVWANFGTFIRNGNPVKIDALAVNDCIQSNLFRLTGPELFEMDAQVRQCLLHDLRVNRGQQFVKEELAAFLYQYSLNNTQGNAWRNYYDAQQWAAIMEVDEKAAAEQILSSLAQELLKKNTSRGLGIVNLIAALEKDNKQFSGLLQHALQKPDTLQDEPAGVTSKRIVLTNEVVDGRAPVKINLPASLSNRLKKIATTTTAETNSEEEGKLFGLFASLENRAGMDPLQRMADYFLQRHNMQAENLRLVLNALTADISDLADTLLSKLKTSDHLIIYINCANHYQETLEKIITPGKLNDLIRKRFPLDVPDIIVMLESYNISSSWYDQKFPAFTLLTTGDSKTGVPESIFQGVGQFEKTLMLPDEDTTYASLYNNLLQTYVVGRSYASLSGLPHFIAGGIDWNYKLFTKQMRDPIQALRKLAGDRGIKAESELAAVQQAFEQSAGEVGREKIISMLQIFFQYSQHKILNALWLLQTSDNFEVSTRIVSKTFVWDETFKNENVLEIVRQLLKAHIVFIGLSPRLLSGINLMRIKTIINICRAKGVLTYFIIEEECEWQQLDINGHNLLLGGTPLARYLEQQGRSAFEKAAYKEIEDLLGSMKPEENGLTYGIFVGINEYMDKQFNLHESVSDARKMSDVLAFKKLMNSENSTVILNNEATRENVVNILKERLSTARSEDTILFYFSGHSSNQQTISSLYFHDLDRTSEYTTQAENGILNDYAFNELVKTAPNNPRIVLILDTHGGSKRWLDENNPKHVSLMATHLEEMSVEVKGVGGMLTEAFVQHLYQQSSTSYIDLYQSVLRTFLSFAHDGNQWQTPLFVVHKDHWNDIFLSATGATAGNTRKPNTREDLQTRETLHCMYYSSTETGAFTFYNQVKSALYEKRVDFEHVNSWSAIDKSFSIRNRFPDMIFIGLKESMYSFEPRYNIEKLLEIADVMQIPVHFILQDGSELHTSVYRSYSIIPANGRPVLSDEDVAMLIGEIEEITRPLVEELKPVEEEYEAWGISIGISHYEHLPGLPPGVHNARRFTDWLSGRLKNSAKPEHCYTFTTGPGITVNKSDIEENIRWIAKGGLKAKRVLYLYACGYAPQTAGDFLICLAPWAAHDSFRNVVNITEYIELFSRAGFAKVIAFTEYVPIEMITETPRSIRFQGETMKPAPSCFFKVQLRVNEDIPGESNSAVLDGLYGEAMEGEMSVTTSSLASYIYTRQEKEGIAQYPDISLQHSRTKDFLIADLAPLLKAADNDTFTFKQKWIFIVGTAKDRLSQSEWLMSNALPRELARSGYGIITGGWRGVDAVAAEAYAHQLAEDKVTDEHYLLRIAVNGQQLGYEGGKVQRFSDEKLAYSFAVSQSYALIMIGGEGGPSITFELAKKADLPTLPIGATGGDAAEVHMELEKGRLLPRQLLDDLSRPINNYDDAERTAAAICSFLDEGLVNSATRDQSQQLR